MDWTPLDLKNLAALFDDIADGILALRRQQGDLISTAKKSELTMQFSSLISLGEDLENMALQGALSDVGTDIKDLQSASHDAIQALQNIDNVQKAISIAVAAIAVGVAVVAALPGPIALSLVALVKSVHDTPAEVAASPGALD